MKALLLDGDCGLCTRFLAFTDKRLSGRPFEYVSLASDIARDRLGEDYARVVDLDTMGLSTVTPSTRSQKPHCGSWQRCDALGAGCGFSE